MSPADRRKINMFEAIWRNDVYFSSRVKVDGKDGRKGGHAVLEIRKKRAPPSDEPVQNMQTAQKSRPHAGT